MLGARLFGIAELPGGYNPPDLQPAGRSLGALLASPVIRWDGDWYLTIAAHGYAASSGISPTPRANFFPLYPLLVATLRQIGTPLLLASVIVSVGAFTVALYLLARLAELERPRWNADAPRSAVTLTVVSLAVSPFSFFFSAAYAESVYLAVSVGAFLCGRRGRWWLAGTLAGLASAARAPGVLLFAPLVVLYLYGPRADLAPDRADGDWRPRYRLRRDFAGLLLAPAGLAAYSAYLGLAGGDPLAFVHTQRLYWDHAIAPPWTTMWEGIRHAVLELEAVVAGHVHPTLFGVQPGASVRTGWEQLLPVVTLIAVLPAVRGVWRAMPRAYGIYVAAALTATLTSPVRFAPLLGFPRYMSVLFPLFMWIGMNLSTRPRLQLPVVSASGVLLAWLSAEFATWHFVA